MSRIRRCATTARTGRRPSTTCSTPATQYHVTSVRVQPTPEQLAARGVPATDTDHRVDVARGRPPRYRGRDPRDRRGVDSGGRQRLRADPGDPGPPERRLGVHVRRWPSRPATTRYTLLEFLTRDEARVLPAVRERHGRDAPNPGYPVADRRGVHAGRARRGLRRVPRHDEREPRLGRGAVPDVRVAGVRADAEPDEPHGERLSEPQRLAARRGPRDVRRLRWRWRGTPGAVGSGERASRVSWRTWRAESSPPASRCHRSPRSRPTTATTRVPPGLVALVPARPSALSWRWRSRRSVRCAAGPGCTGPATSRGRSSSRRTTCSRSVLRTCGHPKAPGETLREYRSRLAAGGTITDGHLDRLTAIAGRAAYAPCRAAAPRTLTRRRKPRRRCSTTCAIGRRSDERIAGQYRHPPVGERPSGAGGGVDGGFAEGPDEPLAILAELRHVGPDAGARCRRSRRRTPSVLRGARRGPHRPAGRS